MSVSVATLPRLVHQFREKFDGANVARCCVLIGAGCSYNSKIPLGGGIVELLKMEAFRQEHIVDAVKWPLDNTAEYREHFDTYINAKNLRKAYDTFCHHGRQALEQQIDKLSPKIKASRLPLHIRELPQEEQDTFFEEKKTEFYQDAQYEYWFSRYSENASDRQRFVEQVIDGKDTGYGYVTLASMMVDGYVQNVFTTNFDDLLHDALMLFFNERVKTYAHSDLSGFLNLRDKKPNIIKLHGDFRYQDIRNTSFEIDETRNRLSEKLSDALSETPCFNLVVMGYGGADVSILNQLLAAKLRNPQSPFRLIWTDRKPLNELHWRVRHLLENTPNNFFLQIENFDLLMLQLHQALQLKPVQIEEKARERQREIDSYYGQMRIQVDNADLPSNEKEELQNFLQARTLFDQAHETQDLEEKCRLYKQATQFMPDFVDAMINWGVALDDLGRYEEAITIYEQALQIEPGGYDILFNWGVVLGKLTHYEEAITKYEQTLQIKFDMHEALFNWGLTLSKLERYEEAINKFKQALQIKPNKHEALSSWGFVLSKLGRYEEAITKYEQTLQIEPDQHEEWFNWGYALNNLERHEEAIVKYEQALKIKPDQYDTLFNWGSALSKLERYEEAIIKFKQVLQIEPDMHKALFGWGYALSKLERYEEAVAKYEQALQIEPNQYNVLFNWGFALSKLGRYKEAIIKYEQTLKIKPDKEDVLLNWGFALTELGRYEEAIAKYEQTLQIKPDQHEAWFNWGYALNELGRYEEAIAKYERALKIKPDKYEALLNWGFALRKLERYEEAITKCDQALKIKPDQYDALLNWGSALNELGRYEEGIVKYEQALQIDPSRYDVLLGWGVTLSKLGRHEEAITKYEQALQIKPDKSDALLKWGVALGELGRHNEAIIKYEQVVQIEPDQYDALVRWGVALSKLGHQKEAIVKYDQAMQINHNNPAALFNIACAHALEADVVKAIHFLKQWRGVNDKATVEQINNDMDFHLILEDPIFQNYLDTWHS